MASRYFVTGASGFVGRHLCEALLARGDQVTAMTRSERPLPRREGLDRVHASLEQPERYGPALAGCDYIVHLAADARFGNGPSYERVNVAGTEALLSAARAHAKRLRRLVLASTIGAVDRAPQDPCDRPLTEGSPAHPTSDYGRSKRTAEQRVAASGLPYAIVRPAWVAGPDMRLESHIAVFARMALAGHPLSRLGLPGSASVLHVDDLAQALILAAESSGASGKILFAAGEAVALRDLFEWAVPGRSRVPVQALATLLRPLARILPFSGKVLLYPALTASDELLRGLGWRPRFSAREAVDQVIRRERARLDPSIAPPGRTVVTGAASGLGRALAELLATRGRRLLLVDRDAAGLAETLNGQANVERCVCDMADYGAVEGLLASEAWRREPVDELFACAGFGLRGAVADLPMVGQADLFRVNLIARLQIAHAALAGMRQRQLGRIVLVSSSSAFQPLPWMSAYAASNAALLLLGEGLAAEVARDGIAVRVICPGGMRTRFQSQAGVKELPGEKLADPADVAEEVLAALGARRVTVLPSTRSKAMALSARVLPRGASLALWKRLMEKLR